MVFLGVDFASAEPCVHVHSTVSKAHFVIFIVFTMSPYIYIYLISRLSCHIQ